MSNKLVKSKKPPQKTNEGICIYNQIGRIFIFLGIISFIILGFVSLYHKIMKNTIFLILRYLGCYFFFFVIVGVLLLLLLGKYCKISNLDRKRSKVSSKQNVEASRKVR